MLAAHTSTPAVPTAAVDRRGGRRHRRVSLRVACCLRMLDEHWHTGGSPEFGETLNVSDSGLAVQLAVPLPLGARVEVLLPHGDGEPACLYGRVTRCRRALSGTYEVGVLLEQDAHPARV